MLAADAVCTVPQQDRYRAYVTSRLPAILHQPMHVASASREVRPRSEPLAGLIVTTGLFAEHRRDRVSSYIALADSATDLLLRPVSVTGLRTIETGLDQTALYGEVTGALGPHVTATAGLRAFRYVREASGTVEQPNLITGTASIAPGRFTTSENGVTWKARLLWKSGSCLLAYLWFADGFRPGRVNITFAPTGAERSYHSDALASYKAGLQARRRGVQL